MDPIPRSAPTSNMAFEAVGRTLVIVHNKDYPTDAEWDAYLKELVSHLKEPDRRSLVWTDGGAPSSKQRARMTALVGESAAPTAVITSAPAVRATVGALNLTNPAIAAFAPEDLGRALQHLGLRDEERQGVVAALPYLRKRVGSEQHHP